MHSILLSSFSFPYLSPVSTRFWFWNTSPVVVFINFKDGRISWTPIHFFSSHSPHLRFLYLELKIVVAFVFFHKMFFLFNYLTLSPCSCTMCSPWNLNDVIIYFRLSTSWRGLLWIIGTVGFEPKTYGSIKMLITTASATNQCFKRLAKYYIN